jgi:hypothetical protein
MHPSTIACVDTVKANGAEQIPVLYNIESKINPIDTNRTQSPEVFVEKQLAIFQEHGLVDRIVGRFQAPRAS